MSILDKAAAAQREAAAGRVGARTGQRLEKVGAIRAGRLVMADDPLRIASRIDRLSHQYPGVRPVSPAALEAKDTGALRAAGAVLERIVNTPDCVDVRYLEAGTRASHAVGRVDIRDQAGHLIGYGTGSLVSSCLLLTNHHVLPDGQTAAASEIEFNFEDDVDGRPRQPKVFPLDPATFYLADEVLDFALVAVGASPAELAEFGFNRMIGDQGKAIAGDFATVVEHNEGREKQVALRDNRIVDVLDDYLHYMADTARGASGSPVFNDQWEMVALHHASVPAPGHPELGGYVNEGIRVSRLLAFIGAQQYTDAQRALVGGLLGRAVTQAPAPPGTAAVSEGIVIDPDYAGRQGYDPQFLGAGNLAVPLPALSAGLMPLAAVNSYATGDAPRHVLPYHHFSVVLNKERRLAFCTAVNIDGASGIRFRREPDRWSFDPRVPREQQMGEEVYQDNPLDRGHLVRRLDPAWGLSAAAAKPAECDTFHFTNCTPQHHDFNAGQTLWAGLEDYILDSAENLRFRVSVFTGPVLAADDQQYRGVQLPRQFWKVVVMVKQDGTLSATAYLLSQEDLIRGLEIAPEAFAYDAYRTYQVPVRRIETLTGLSFGPLADADPLARQEAAVSAWEVRRPRDLAL